MKVDLTTAPNNKTPNWHQRCSCGSGCLRSLGARDVCVIVYVSLLTCFFIPSSGQKSVMELERFMNIANIYMLMNAAQLLKTSALWSNFSFDACELRQALVTSSRPPSSLLNLHHRAEGAFVCLSHSWVLKVDYWVDILLFLRFFPINSSFVVFFFCMFK